ncbi:MAG: hypothetical protein ACR2NN_00675 [Bryobacteraceae bacterium]
MKKIDWNLADDGFVLSREQIRAGLNRRNHCDKSHMANYAGYDLKKFQDIEYSRAASHRPGGEGS